jgi:hypothetical protein
MAVQRARCLYRAGPHSGAASGRAEECLGEDLSYTQDTNVDISLVQANRGVGV